MRRIFLSTPLRDEMSNLVELFNAVSSQSERIACWVIVENGSTDGSREWLESVQCPANVDALVVLNYEPKDAGYALGSKYADVVKRGFDEIRGRYELAADDLIGILDADSFPEPDYYSKLICAFDSDPSLGITSGTSRVVGDGRSSGHATNWVRGSCRLWRGVCFIESGYVVGPSADTLSLGLAELGGWRAYVVKDAVFLARDVGERSDYRYYGRAAYFRGNTLFYAILRSSKMIATLKFNKGRAFLVGYVTAMLAREPRVEDLRLRQHFSGYVGRKISALFGFSNVAPRSGT